MRTTLLLFLFGVLWYGVLAAEETAPSKERTGRISRAVTRGLTIVGRAAGNYPKHRKCFSCHHQTLPLLAMQSAGDAGIKVDGELFARQLDFTRTSFSTRRENLQKGERIGGRAATVGYALWTLAIADAKPDPLAADLVAYLLKTQQADGRWRPPSHRPPLEDSHVTCTVLAAYGLTRYAEASQEEAAMQAVTRAQTWLATAKLVSQEDRVARLWGLVLFPGEDRPLQSARETVWKTQRKDGGWAQLDDRDSDAYATGQTLFVLHQSGVTPNRPQFARGIGFLLKTQQKDGSWLVRSRSKPVQQYFDNGDPHGKDQFISIAATSWAVAALSAALPRQADIDPSGEK